MIAYDRDSPLPVYAGNPSGASRCWYAVMQAEEQKLHVTVAMNNESDATICFMPRSQVDGALLGRIHRQTMCGAGW
jgi:hypothetical protein